MVIDILEQDIHNVLQMERLNLNIPSAIRAALRELAAKHDRKEAEYARELLVQAVEQAEREEFFVAMEEGMTPAARRRLRAVSKALERLGGSSR